MLAILFMPRMLLCHKPCTPASHVCNRPCQPDGHFWEYMSGCPHLPLDKMAVVWQTTFWNALSWMKIFEFQIKVHWNMFLGSNCQYVSTGSDNGLAPFRQQAIFWTNADPVHRRIQVALGGDELTLQPYWRSWTLPKLWHSSPTITVTS